MKYGAMNFPVRPILEELNTFSTLDFDYLELTLDPPQAHYSTIRRQKKRLLEALARYRMGLVCHLPTFLSTADLTDSLREASLHEMIKSLDVAKDLEASKIILHPSYMSGLSVFVKERARKYAMGALETLVERGDNLGLCLCIENMFPGSHSFFDPRDFEDLFRYFPSLQLNLDIGHAHIGDQNSRRCLAFIENFYDRIVHVHASDNFGKEDNHLPIGAGTINYPKIARALKKIGYNQTITLEIFSRDRDYLRISKEKLAALFSTP